MLNQLMTSTYPMHTPMPVPMQNEPAKKLIAGSMAMPTGLILNSFIKELISLFKGNKTSK